MAKKKSVVTDEIKVDEVVETVEAKTYTVLVTFKDKDGSIHNKGTQYQSDDSEWIAYLRGDKNSQKKPIIK